MRAILIMVYLYFIARRGQGPFPHGVSQASARRETRELFLKKQKPRFLLFPFTPQKRRTDEVNVRDFIWRALKISRTEGKAVRVSP